MKKKMKMTVSELRNKLKEFPKGTPIWVEHQSGLGQASDFTGVLVDEGKAYLDVCGKKKIKKVKHLLRCLDNVDDSLPIVVSAFDSYFHEDTDEDFLLEYHIGCRKPHVILKIPSIY